jgi:hypothetical protein
VDWTLMNTDLTDVFVSAIVIDPTDATTVYVGTSGGVFKSNNGAGKWAPVNIGLADPVVSALALDPAGSTLHAGGSGIFHYQSAPAQLAVFRPAKRRWYLDNGNGIDESCNVDKCLGVFGQPGDLPVVGDWRGRGQTLIGVFRPSTRQFLLEW